MERPWSVSVCRSGDFCMAGSCILYKAGCMACARGDERERKIFKKNDKIKKKLVDLA